MSFRTGVGYERDTVRLKSFSTLSLLSLSSPSFSFSFSTPSLSLFLSGYLLAKVNAFLQNVLNTSDVLGVLVREAVRVDTNHSLINRCKAEDNQIPFSFLFSFFLHLLLPSCFLFHLLLLTN